MEADRMECRELSELLAGGGAVTVLDVRNPADYAASKVKIKGAVRIPAGELAERCTELDRAREVVAYCT